MTVQTGRPSCMGLAAVQSEFFGSCPSRFQEGWVASVEQARSQEYTRTCGRAKSSKLRRLGAALVACTLLTNGVLRA